MSPRLTISVIITNYNYARYVGKTIESVLCQTRLPDEIIVIDDGSTDNSRQVIERYQGRITAVFQPNEGMNPVKNRGYARSSGDLVMFLDSDDIIYPTAIEAVERAFGPGIAKVQFELDIIDSDGVYLGRRFCGYSRRLSVEDTKRQFEQTGTYIWPVTSGNVYARSFLQQVMPLTPAVGHDGDLCTIAPLYGGIATIIEPHGAYRVHSLNISRVDDAGRINVVPDFASRIRFRKQEFATLRAHAKRLGKTLPEGDLLDQELVFINYRLMARKIGHEDSGDEKRLVLDLWLKGILAAAGGSFGIATAFKHIAWLCCLTAAPRPLAHALVELRYARTHWRASLRRLIRLRPVASPGR
ncbi:glycosyltransferase [Bradyrhizobium sp. RT3b]|uniref:glycosyltransferase n=1 Tax=Bradyrhizobium sp. RT3b TaxID=3156334 RepID=UPI003392099A